MQVSFLNQGFNCSSPIEEHTILHFVYTTLRIIQNIFMWKTVSLTNCWSLHCFVLQHSNIFIILYHNEIENGTGELRMECAILIPRKVNNLPTIIEYRFSDFVFRW